MRFIKELFSEEGQYSMVRLMAIISLLTGCYLAISGKDGATLFVTSAFAAKVLQRHVEQK